MDRASSVANPWHGTPMNRSWFPRALASLPVLLTACLVLSPLACTSSGGADTADGGTEGGDGDGDGDCSVSYSWNPGAGDVTSFPTWEMAVEDANTPTGQRVQVSVDEFPGFTTYDRWDVTITRDLNDLDGFSVLGEAFLGFDGALADTLARESATADTTDPIGMAILDGDGVATQVPVAVELWDDGTTVAIRPMKTLPENTRVVVYVRGDAPAADGGCVKASDGLADALAAPPTALAEGVDALTGAGIISSADDLAAVQVYKTQSLRRDSAAIAQSIAALPDSAVALGDRTCEDLESGVRHCFATLAAGDYRNSEFVVDVDLADPQPTAPWDLVVHMYMPAEASASPRPTLLYGHGLEGQGTNAEGFAERVLDQGWAVVAVSTLAHGDHPNTNGMPLAGIQQLLEFFGADFVSNTIDARKLRDHFRQAAYDKLRVVRMLQTGPDLDGDGTQDVDPAKLGYLGVSLGGIMGGELMGLTDALSAGTLFVPGGRLSAIATDPNGSFGDVLSILIPKDYTDGDFYRLFAMIQAVLDDGDPSTHAPHILQTRPDFAPNTPDLLMGVVLGDTVVPNSTSWSLARALEIPIYATELEPVVGLTFDPTLPLSGNVNGRTAGLVQFDVTAPGEAAQHGPTVNKDVGIAAWRPFFETHFGDGLAVLTDPYATVGLDHE